MKTTSFEISKKLKEAGFEAETDFNWNTRTTYCGNTPKKVQYFIKYNNGLKEGEEICKSYDLETPINALPDSITREYKSKEDGEVREFRETLKIDKYEIYYRCCDIETSDDANRYFNEYGYMQEFSVYNFSNTGSLADTAGKMWLLLKDKGLVC